MKLVTFNMLVTAAALILAVAPCQAGAEPIADKQAATTSCPTRERAGWSSQEVWVWRQLCAGQIANLVAKYGGSADPEKAASWPPERTLNAGFLETILTAPEFQQALPHQAVRILGARFTGRLDLENATIERALNIQRSYFEEEVVLSNAEIREFLSLQTCVFQSRLNLTSATVRKALTLDQSRLTALDLNDGWIGQSLYLTQARIDRVDMKSLSVGNDLYGNNSEFIEFFDANGARIGNQMNLSEAEFFGTTKMDSMRVGLNLFLRDAKAHEGINLNRAEIKGNLQAEGIVSKKLLLMNGIRVGRELRLENAKTENILLRGAEIDGVVSLIGSRVTAGRDTPELDDKTDDKTVVVDLDKAKVGSNVFLDKGIYSGKVNLTGARIGSQLSLKQTVISDQVVASSMEVRGDAVFDEGHFGRGIQLLGSKIGGALSLQEALVRDRVKLDRVSVGKSANLSRLRITKSNEATAVPDGESDPPGLLMRAVDIGDQLSLVEAVIDAHLILDSTAVGGDFFLSRGVKVMGWAALHFSRIDGNLEIAQGNFTCMDLTGTAVRGEFRLGSKDRAAPKWTPNAACERQPTLSLRNTTVGVLHDLPEAWPSHLDLTGFSYKQLGGLAAGTSEDIAQRSAEAFEAWLAKQPVYVPQPYQQLARVLRDAGAVKKAETILYASKERERKEAAGLFKRIFLFVRLIFFGHGHHSEYALIWIGGLLCIGALIVRTTPEAQRHGIRYGIAYSFDMLLPFIELRKFHYERIDLEGWPRYYFYFHRLMGYGFLAVATPDLVKVFQ